MMTSQLTATSGVFVDLPSNLRDVKDRAPGVMEKKAALIVPNINRSITHDMSSCVH